MKKSFIFFRLRNGTPWTSPDDNRRPVFNLRHLLVQSGNRCCQLTDLLLVFDRQFFLPGCMARCELFKEWRNIIHKKVFSQFPLNMLYLDIGPYKVNCKNMFLKWNPCNLCFIILFYYHFIPCHLLSIMMFKCTLMKEQINCLKSNQSNKMCKIDE